MYEAPTPVEDGNTTRLLPHDEWHRLRTPVKRLFGEDKEPPSPEAAPLCAVEEDSAGNIVGFLFLQLCAHLEPFGSLGGASLSGLKAVIDKALLRDTGLSYYMYTDSPIGVAKAEQLGFERIGVMLKGSPRRS